MTVGSITAFLCTSRVLYCGLRGVLRSNSDTVSEPCDINIARPVPLRTAAGDHYISCGQPLAGTRTKQSINLTDARFPQVEHFDCAVGTLGHGDSQHDPGHPHRLGPQCLSAYHIQGVAHATGG